MEKKLYRSRTEKKVCGVCGGLAKYLEMDVSIMRLIAVLLILFAGGGLLVYIICALVTAYRCESCKQLLPYRYPLLY